ncbi:putative baseplate assembly protein [Acinetobacter phage ABPH49]|nr:putative baseplate assembly protein [Acinetobacter phage ABPH49]
MAATDRLDAALGIYTDRYMRNNVHTNIRARVVSVNVNGPRVDVQPMAFTVFESGAEDRYPVIFDVPLQLPSGNGGKARLSMPVKPGDIVGLSFSERNENDVNDKNTHQLFAGWAVTEIFTEGNSKPIHPDNVELENDKVKFSMTPDGDYTLETPKGSFKLLKDGTLSGGNGAGSLTITPEGQITAGNANGGLTIYADGESKFNGGTITKDGNFITAQGVDLNAFWQDYVNHRHSGVQTGSGNTGPKV